MTTLAAGLEIDSTEGVPVGRLPKSMTLGELAALGHEPQPVAKAIRAKCIDCSGGKVSEVRRCVATTCPLWPLRMGTNPFHGSAAQAAKSPEDRQVLEAA
ncbi:hypothetical protein [Methylobacterium brachythecii]|uniref:Uncharacterized protein n=1 Tax=Methylobacterium brachythecii TaxID=1176177 RepID=A0A7W6F6Y7_9HYPH|nr:hypothetical protein [Methylobacterium brachythecii]MBB3902810.1 hypothetical protein [Methylobacterium brachythecii]GLS43735.1 hypothetical protein GCM10007884_17200 [Methylobacterium brachythecii]